MTEAITRFRDQHYFLSSMFPLPNGVETRDGHVVRSVEVGYQADKWINFPEIRRRFLGMRSGYEAKRHSRALEARGYEPIVGARDQTLIDEKKVQTMRWYVAQKFMRNQNVTTRLLATGDQIIIEGNHWDDDFFGACLDENGQLVGRNNLGLILMEARDLLQEKQPLTMLNQRLGAITVAQVKNWTVDAGIEPQVA